MKKILRKDFNKFRESKGGKEIIEIKSLDKLEKLYEDGPEGVRPLIEATYVKVLQKSNASVDELKKRLKECPDGLMLSLKAILAEFYPGYIKGTTSPQEIEEMADDVPPSSYPYLEAKYEELIKKIGSPKELEERYDECPTDLLHIIEKHYEKQIRKIGSLEELEKRFEKSAFTSLCSIVAKYYGELLKGEVKSLGEEDLEKSYNRCPRGLRYLYFVV